MGSGTTKNTCGNVNTETHSVGRGNVGHMSNQQALTKATHNIMADANTGNYNHNIDMPMYNTNTTIDTHTHTSTNARPTTKARDMLCTMVNTNNKTNSNTKSDTVAYTDAHINNDIDDSTRIQRMRTITRLPRRLLRRSRRAPPAIWQLAIERQV